MLLPAITPYAAILALLYVVLGFHVIGQRVKYKVALGTGEADALTRAVRAHGNFSEYVPLALLLLLLLEFAGIRTSWIHVLSGLLVIARASHTYSLIMAEVTHGSIRYRQAGMVGTFSVLGISAFLLISAWVQQYVETVPF